METLTFQCGHCNKLMAVGVANIGQQVRCPHCQQVVIAPSQPASPQLPQEPRPVAVDPVPDWLGNSAPDAHRAATDPVTSPVHGTNSPQMELAPAAPTNPPPTPAPMQWYEDAVSEMTPSAAASAAVTDVSAPEPPIPPAVEMPTAATHPGPSAAVPWGDAGAPDAGEVLAPPSRTTTRPRKSGMGLTYFISFVFLPLVLYAVLVTILAAMFWSRLQRGEGGGGSDPRQFLPDEGDHPGIKHSKQSLIYPEHFYNDPLPRSWCVALGKTLTVGDLEVQPERVEWGKVHIRLGGKLENVDKPALILHLKLRNVSDEVSFYPLDKYFTREWRQGEGPKPLTVVEAGQNRYYGGPAHFGARESEAIEGSNFDQELAPGQSGDYIVCTNCFEDATQKLAKYAGPLLWRVQLRRGLVRYRDKDYSATAVVGIEFSDKDVVHSVPKN